MSHTVLDVIFLRSITDGNRATENEFFVLFGQTVEKTTQAMQAALDSQNDNDWQEAVHELKGAASYLGARKLQQTCENAYEAALSERQLCFEDIMQSVQELEAKLQALQAS